MVVVVLKDKFPPFFSFYWNSSTEIIFLTSQVSVIKTLFSTSLAFQQTRLFGPGILLANNIYPGKASSLAVK